MTITTLDLRATAVPDIPRSLALAHRDLPVGALCDIRWPVLDEAARHDLVIGGGFVPRLEGIERARTLTDTVAPGLRLLVCGLNPSLHAADAGVGFVTPSNRFWRAAVAADVVTATLDPWHALDVDRVGMTDLVKRATPRAADLRADEYRSGYERVERLCALLRPRAAVFVGLAGWRAAVDRRAVAGWQPRLVGPTPVYLMPSTSGLNAGTSLATLTDHLARAASPTSGSRFLTDPAGTSGS